MNLQFIANNADAMLVFGLFGLMGWCVAWLTRRGLHILHEGTYFRTYVEHVFRWNRVYRYGTPVYIVAWSSIGGAAVMIVTAVIKLFVYPLEMPFWWRIPFEAIWQGLPIPLLGYMLAEWLYERQKHPKGKRDTPQQENRAIPLEVIRRLTDEESVTMTNDTTPEDSQQAQT